MSFDLNKLALDLDEAEMVLENPDTGEPIIDPDSNQPLAVMVLSSDSEKFRKRERRLNQRHMKTARRRGVSFDDLQTDKAVAAVGELTPKNAWLLNAKIVTADDHDSLVDMFTKHTWIRDQIIEWNGQRDNYRGK